MAGLPLCLHRAGLAGLVLMVQWLERQPRTNPGVCRIERLDVRGLALRIDPRGLEELFDEAYGATLEEIAVDAKRKKKDGKIDEPIRTEERQEVDKKGKPRTKLVHFYPQVVPKGAFLGDLDPTADGSKGLWVKLWRDMVWSVLRGIPAQRTPYDARADGQPGGEAAEAWVALRDPLNASVDLPSTYYLGAQAYTAELVPFRDRAKTQFLLHFAAFVFQVYVPAVVDADGNREFHGYALAVPDVCDLHGLCEAFGPCLRARPVERSGYRPRGAVVELAVEGALDFLARLRQRVSAAEGASETSGLVLGVDVFHLEKEGNNVRIRGTARIEPEPAMVDEYQRIRQQYWDPTFRRARLLNLISGKRWCEGFGRIASTLPASRTISSGYFQHDARVAFETEKGEVWR